MKKLLHIFYFSCLLASWAGAQTVVEDKVIEKDTDHNNDDYIFRARERVSLEPGFSINGQAGNLLEALIDESLIVDAEYIPENQIVAPQSRALDKSLPVGTPAGGLSVTPSGAASYNIPIEISPGTAGMEPNISISYNSMGGNGLLGYGWDITGISYITRTAGNNYNRSEPFDINRPYQIEYPIEEVAYDNNDMFELDGQELILKTGTYGNNLATYSKEIQDFTVITSYGDAGGDPEYFVAETKNGMKFYYGNADADANAGVKVRYRDNYFAWFLYKVEDPNGNYMTYDYLTDHHSGEVVLSSIKYTGNGNIGLEPYNEIKFYYEKRSDKITSSIGQVTVEMEKQLWQIKCFSHGKLYRKYLPEYFFNRYTYLNEMKVYNGNDERHNSLAFGYNAFTHQEESNAKANLNNTDLFAFGDFDNNSASDLIIIDASGDASVYEYNWSTQAYSSSASLIHAFSSQPDIFKVGDFNGDGFTDLVLMYNEITNRYRLEYYTTSDAGFSFQESAILTGDFENGARENIHIKDFDGNGIDDILLVDNTSDDIDIFFGAEDNSMLSTTYSENIPGTSSSLMFGKFRGNQDNLAVHYNNELIVYQVYPKFITGALIAIDIITEPMPLYRDILLFDFSGDGRTDILCTNNGGDTEFNILGILELESFTYYSITPLSIPTITGTAGVEYIIKDLDGDKREDIISIESEMGEYAPEMKYTHWLSTSGYQTGELFIIATSTTPDAEMINPMGLGQVALVRDNNNLMAFSFNADYRPGNLTHIADGMNRQTEIVYDFSSNSNLVTIAAADYSYPLTNLKYPTQLVKKVISTSGTDAPYETDYTYKNPVRNADKKTFLGFMERTITSQASGLYTVIEKDFAHVFTTGKTIKSYNADGVLYASEGITYSTEDLQDRQYMRKVASSWTTDHLAGITNTTTYNYDDYANVTEKVVDHNGLATTTTTAAYSQHGGTVPNKPDNVTVTRTESDKTDYSRTTNYSYSDHRLTGITSDPGTDKEISTALTYNNLGLLTRTDVTPADGAATSFKELTYEDSYYRFVVEEEVTGNFTSSYTYDGMTGNVLTSTDIYGHTTSYSYDGLGALVSSTHPVTGTSTISRTWSGGNLGDDVVVQTVSGEQVPDVTSYFDILGRVIRSETTKFEGTPINTSYQYSFDGLTSSVSVPYEGQSASEWITKTLDKFYRPVQVTGPGVHTTYVYSGLSSTVTNQISGNQVVTTLNGLGQVDNVVDPNGTVSYTYYTSGQVHETITPDGNLTYQYDLHGNVISTSTINAGTSTATYNSLGQVLSTTNAKSQTTTYSYDGLGRLESFTAPDGTTTYAYVNSGNGKGQIENITHPAGFNQAFGYDAYGRLLTSTETIDGENYTSEIVYDNLGRIASTIYPSGFGIDYNYTSEGYLEGIDYAGGNIWTQTATNHLGQVTGYDLGNGLSTSRTYNNLGQLTGIQTGAVQHLTYAYNPYNLMESRHDELNNLDEYFTYDDNHLRLTGYGVTGHEQTIEYGTNGNITLKSDLGEFTYDNPAQPHAVTEVENNPQTIALNNQDIQYNYFNKVTQINENGYELNIEYGIGGVRKKTTLELNDAAVKEKIFVGGLYEKEILADGTERELHYIPGPDGIAAIFTLENGEAIQGGDMHYIHKDHLGSFDVITDASGNEVERMSFDPWGRRRNPNNWTYNNVPEGYMFDRGFTGHEHLDVFGIINMNGRVYDPLLARFLNSDPLFHAQDGVEGFNGYSYVGNNPLHFTDPSGYKKYEKGLDAAMRHWSTFLPFTERIVHGDYKGGSGSSWYSYWNSADADEKAKDGSVYNSIVNYNGFEAHGAEWNVIKSRSYTQNKKEFTPVPLQVGIMEE
jgi:RHS repeat-associated protein